jgi:hypothetical protein
MEANENLYGVALVNTAEAKIYVLSKMRNRVFIGPAFLPLMRS